VSSVKTVTKEPVDIPKIDWESVVVPIPIILLEEGITLDFEDITNCPVTIPIVVEDPTTDRATNLSEPVEIVPTKLVTKVSSISSVTGSL